MGICYMTQRTQTGLCKNLDRLGWVGGGREIQEGGDICTPRYPFFPFIFISWSLITCKSMADSCQCRYPFITSLAVVCCLVWFCRQTCFPFPTQPDQQIRLISFPHFEQGLEHRILFYQSLEGSYN